MRISDWSSDVCSSDLTVDRDQDYYGADELCAVGRRRSRQVECVAAPVERGVECNIAAQHVDVLLSDGANDLQPAVNRRAAATARGSLPVASGLPADRKSTRLNSSH